MDGWYSQQAAGDRARERRLYSTVYCHRAFIKIESWKVDFHHSDRSKVRTKKTKKKSKGHLIPLASKEALNRFGRFPSLRMFLEQICINFAKSPFLIVRF